MILIGLGGNLDSPRWGSPRQTLEAALRALVREDLHVAACSSYYASEPVPSSDQPWFVNAVAALASPLGPAELLARLQRVEAEFGRVRGARNAPRTLDLDLLDHDGRLIETADLVLPHPRLHLRRFVLMPLAEIARDWRHPRVGLTAAELLARLDTGERVCRIQDRADGAPPDCAGSPGPI